MSDLLSNKMDRSIIGALLNGPAQEEWNEIKAETVAIEQRLAECQTEIQHLPVPAIEMGDGPNERVSNVLTKLGALVEQATNICGNASEVGADPRHYQVPKQYVNAMYGLLQEFEGAPAKEEA